MSQKIVRPQLGDLTIATQRRHNQVNGKISTKKNVKHTVKLETEIFRYFCTKTPSVAVL